LYGNKPPRHGHWGSFVGLLAGRALTNHFDRITIIERDHYPEQPASRPGVLQSRYPHILTLQGLLLLEQFFPGLRKDLLELGAIELDVGSDIALLTPKGWAVRSPLNQKILACSRDLLDWTLRQRLKTFPNLHFLEGEQVSGLLATAQQTQIVGVTLRSRDTVKPATRTTTQSIQADWVVDASGKASRSPQWLQDLGYESPPETKLDAFVGYTARICQCPDPMSVDWKLLFIQSAPPQRCRGAAIFPIEGNRWITSLVGGDRDYPPTDEAGFLEFARSLPTPVFYDAIQTATPLMEIYQYRGNENRLRHYDRLRRRPKNFVAIGHAACFFNPTYGQGMTVAALEAVILDRFFQQGSCEPRQAHRLQKQLSQAHADAWLLATSWDSRYQGSLGKQITPLTPLLNWYFDQITALMTTDVKVYRTVLEVTQMLKSSTALFHPNMMASVLYQLPFTQSLSKSLES
jgi:2-polyprenyl-6-methoxyphenol hydroxylase-like FAD-dependent oxidoreductase